MSRRAETLEELGAYLREVRESLGISLDRAGQELHVRKVYLSALERGAWDELPGTAYGRGYLRQYAGYLGVAVDEIMQTLDVLQGKVTTDLRYFDPVRREQLPSRLVMMMSAALLLGAIAAWAFTKPKVDGAQQALEIREDLSNRFETVEEAPAEATTDAACLNMARKPGVVCFHAEDDAAGESLLRQDPLLPKGL